MFFETIAKFDTFQFICGIPNVDFRFVLLLHNLKKTTKILFLLKKFISLCIINSGIWRPFKNEIDDISRQVSFKTKNTKV